MTRAELLSRVYHDVRKAKMLVAVVSATEDVPALDEPNQSRLERAKLHLLDAIVTINAVMEPTQ